MEITEEDITALTASLAQLLIKGAKYAVPEKRNEYSGNVYRELMETTGRLAKEAVKSANGNSGKLRAYGLAERNYIEMKLRRCQLSYPRSEAEFESSLRWMVARGNDDDLVLIRAIRNETPYLSPKVSQLFAIAEERISERSAAEPSGVSAEDTTSTQEKSAVHGAFNVDDFMNRHAEKCAWMMLSVSLLMLLVAFLPLRSTAVGFAMAFGASIVGYESYLLLKACK